MRSMLLLPSSRPMLGLELVVLRLAGGSLGDHTGEERLSISQASKTIIRTVQARDVPRQIHQVWYS